MQFKKLIFIVLVLCPLIFMLNRCKTLKYSQNITKNINCPIKSLNETKEDCPWAAITRKMNKLGVTEKDVIKILDTYSPSILKAILKDAKKDIIKNMWGESINFDEIKKEVIIKPLILNTILKLAKTPCPKSDREYFHNKSIAHAGITHTYGYLFSNLLTPYGYKRARWVKDNIESGFNLPRGILGPTPKAGTLFTNITYFISRIAFCNEPEMLIKLKTINIHPALKKFKFKKLKVKRLNETVKLQKDRIISLRTDCIRFFKNNEKGENGYLLIYSYLDSQKKTPLLITTFPVSDRYVNRLFNKLNLGKNKLIKTRYNAFISNFTNSKYKYKGLREDVQLNFN